MKTPDNTEGKHKDKSSASLEKYLLMDEREKDIEVQNAVNRLQKRIQEILYLLETDKPHIPGVKPENKKE